MFLAGEGGGPLLDEKLTIEFNGSRPCLSAVGDREGLTRCRRLLPPATSPSAYRGMAGRATGSDQICQFFSP